MKSILTFLPVSRICGTSNGDGNVSSTGCTEYSAVAIDLARQAQRFRVVVGKLHCGTPVDFAQFAHQAYRVKTFIAAWVALAKVVGQVRSPTGAEADPMVGNPFALVEKVLNS